MINSNLCASRLGILTSSVDAIQKAQIIIYILLFSFMRNTLMEIAKIINNMQQIDKKQLIDQL